MRKHFLLAGLVFVFALLAVRPAAADSATDNFHLTGIGFDITFSLPSVLTPSSVNSALMIGINDISVTYVTGTTYTLATEVQLGPVGYGGNTNFFAIGDHPPILWVVAPGLFTWNPDGTVTLNSGTFMLADWYVGQPRDFTLTVTDPPVTTPEPASLALLGVGGLALAAFRRRKAA